MSYPNTPEQRLIQLFGYTQQDLLKIYIECKKDKVKYIERVNQLDSAHSISVFNEMISENFILH